MGIPDLGFSNPYLKLGTALMVVAIVIIALLSFFSFSGTHQTTLNVGELLLGSGIVVYIVGRLVKALQSK